MNSWDLEKKRALVTGGSKGIGKAIVNEFLPLGADVVFTARHAAEVAAVEQEFRQMGFPVHGVASDVALDPDRKSCWNGSAVRGAFLAMDIASYITGHNLSVDSGATSGLL